MRSKAMTVMAAMMGLPSISTPCGSRGAKCSRGWDRASRRARGRLDRRVCLPYIEDMQTLNNHSHGNPVGALPAPTCGESVHPCARPRVWTVFVVYGLALAIGYLIVPLVVLAVAILTSGLSHASHANTSALIESVVDDVRGRITLLIGWELTFGLIAVLAGLLSPVPWRSRLAIRLPQMSCREFMAVVAGAVGISFMLTAALSFVAVRTQLTAEIGKMVAGFGRDHIFIVLTATALLPGIAEELFFRGYVQTRLCERWGAGSGILWTSLLFGLCHLNLWQGAGATAFGLYVGFVTLEVRSVLPAMAAHGVYNAIGTGFEIAEIPLPRAVVFLAGFLLLLVSVCCLPKGPGERSAHPTHSGTNG